MSAVARNAGVAITNPLVLYRSLIATKRIDPDPAQHRLAIHLQKLYENLIDYEPVVQHNQRINQISRELGNPSAKAAAEGDASQRPPSGGALSSLFKQEREEEKLALTRVLTSHEETLQMQSPRGLMLHGEVGTVCAAT